MSRTRIKFCGLTSSEDVALAVDAGADAVGVILAPSPRRVPLEAVGALAESIPPFVSKFAVVAEPGEDELVLARALGFTLQFSGGESAEACEGFSAGRPYVKVFHVGDDPGAWTAASAAFESAPNALWQFDTHAAGRAGGSGRTFAWDAVAPVARRRRVVVSGGLTPENVAACVRMLRPYAVDVRGGVETGGMKDREKMGAFVRAVRDADAEA